MSHTTELRLPASRLLSLAFGLGRRATRTMRLTEPDRAGVAFRGQDPVQLTDRWRRFRSGSVEFEARAAVPRLVAVHKGAGVVVSRREDGSELATLWEAFSHVPEADALQAVGRLDADSEGLLLLTGDGRLLHGLTRPSSAVERRYLAWLERAPDEERIVQLLGGELVLRDGHRPRPLRVARADQPAGAPDGEECWEMVLTEGKYHEVRRAFAACGARVVRLLRTSFGPVGLGTELAVPGSWCRLEGELLAATYAAAGVPMVADAVEVRRLEPGDGA